MKKAQAELLDLNGIGLSILEISHRSKDFEAVTGKITIDGERNAVKSGVVLQVKGGGFVYRTTVQAK